MQDAETDVFEDVAAFARVDGGQLKAPLPQARGGRACNAAEVPARCNGAVGERERHVDEVDDGAEVGEGARSPGEEGFSQV